MRKRKPPKLYGKIPRDFSSAHQRHLIDMYDLDSKEHIWKKFAWWTLVSCLLVVLLMFVR